MENQTRPGGPPVTPATLQQPPNVGSALVSLFLCARARHGALCNSWAKASFALGGRLPASLLMTSVQRDGDIDMVLRSVEDEIASGASNLQDPIQSPLHYLNHLSSCWISSVYETLRLLRDRKQLEETDRVADLFRAIELVRITIDKHEIAGDGKLKVPLQMTRLPAKGDPTDAYVYARNDSSRAYIMPTGLSQSYGSLSTSRPTRKGLLNAAGCQSKSSNFGDLRRASQGSGPDRPWRRLSI
jgi:hypothetical protein